MPPPEDASEESRESLYAILNLPVSASQDVIRHRYKDLAVIFHPDRQSRKDEETRKLAEKRFQDIHRAYEVLSNPELRRIYDTLGEAGLTAYKAVGRRNSSPDQLRADFERLLAEARGASQRTSLSSGQLICALDLTDALKHGYSSGIYGLSRGIKEIKSNFLSVTHSTEVNITNNTQMSLSGVITAGSIPQGQPSNGNVMGVIRHQFSPNFRCGAMVHLLRSHTAALETAYQDDENELLLRTVLSPKINILTPPTTLQLQRKLFVDSALRGVLRFHFAVRPRFFVSIFSPPRPASNFSWSAGLNLAGYPTLSTEVKTRPLSGGFSAALGVDLGLAGPLTTVTGKWTDERENVVAVKIGAGNGNLFVNINLERADNRILIPIVLSYEIDELIGVCAILVPSVLATLAHNFVIQPRVRARRLLKLQAARDSRRDLIDRRRDEAAQTVALLSEGATWRAEHERAIGGLVILKANYIVSAEDEEIPTEIDVTIPLQAQVRQSQLTIPGGRPKAGLLGFYDPSPGSRKRLKIEYLFHGRLHVTDVGDFTEVNLPLRGHLVE